MGHRLKKTPEQMTKGGRYSPRHREQQVQIFSPGDITDRTINLERDL